MDSKEAIGEFDTSRVEYLREYLEDSETGKANTISKIKSWQITSTLKNQLKQDTLHATLEAEEHYKIFQNIEREGATLNELITRIKKASPTKNKK